MIEWVRLAAAETEKRNGFNRSGHSLGGLEEKSAFGTAHSSAHDL